MIDLTKITRDEANKIECALLMLDSEIKNIIDSYEKASTYEELTEQTRKTMKSNAEWWREFYEMINR